MSLSRFAIRLAAVQALKGRTLAGDAVRNSRIGAIDVAADGSLQVNEDRVFLDVFTDDSETTDAYRRDLHENGDLALNFESGITSTMVETDDAGQSVVTGVGIPATDDAFEATLDILDTQIRAALTNPANEWAEIWLRLTNGFSKIERKRAASADDGLRRAARQLRITLKARPDPVLNEPLAETSPFKRFRALVERDLPNMLPQVDMMMGLPADGYSIDMIRSAYGHTQSEADALAYTLVRDDPIAGFTVKDIDDEQPST